MDHGAVGKVVVKRALLIAFQFPPMSGTSAIQRTLRFAQHLPEFGWQPLVLSAAPRAYPATSNDQLRDIAANMPVVRAFALDTARQLSIAGRYPSLLATPDRWISWWLGAVPSGLALVRRHRPQVIWSTYPIATAHVIGATLSRLSGLPWIADFRDSMTETDYPRDPATRRWFRRIERMTIERCTKAVFTTPGAVRMYRDRYPEIPVDRFVIIENGFDEGSFADVRPARGAGSDASRPLTLVHSGVIYPTERDPRHFFEAVGALQAAGRLDPHTLQVVLRAPGHESLLKDLIEKHGIGDMVRIEPSIPYRAALMEMLSADGLLVLQGADCNHQIPAKVYEYLRAGRPILGLTDPAGDTAGVLREAGVDTVAPLESKSAIEAELQRFVTLVRSGSAPLPNDAVVRSHSRQKRTRLLANLFDSAMQLETYAMRRSVAR